MSQAETFGLLKELGGRATSKELKQLAKERYPELTLWIYISKRLRQLRYNGKIDFNEATNEWYIKI